MSFFATLFGARAKINTPGFGLAVVGTGHGAHKMCDALRHSPSVRVAAVLSSSQEKAQRFARRYRIERTYTYDRLEQIADDPAIDAVYLALPVALHRSFTERAARAGKHVLCEKPMAATVDDAQAMIAACAEAQRLLMIAYRLDYDPMHAEAQRLLASGSLGAVTHVESGFGIVAKPGWRFDPALAGGGSLFDVGVYPLHALFNFFGNPTVTSARVVQQRGTGLEVDAEWSGTLPGGATFACTSSYVRHIPDTLRMTCERGTLTLQHAYAYERTRLAADFIDASGQQQRLRLHDARSNPSLFRLEAEHLAHCAQTGAPLRSPGASGLRDLVAVAEIEARAECRMQ